MANTAILAIRVVTDAVKASKEVDQLGNSTGKLEQRAARASKVAKGVAVGIGLIGAASFKAASDQQQAFGAVDSVFGKQAAKVKKLAGTAAESVGLAKSEYADLAAVLGSQLGNMGVAQDKLVGSTDALVKKGGDLAATFGGTTADAVSALSALLRGEADPIERYGVSIKDADIKARLAAKGQDKLTGAAAKSARTQAILELLNKQTAKATGQRAREANSAASRQQVAMAKIKNAGATLGAVLLPVFASVAAIVAKVAGFVEDNSRAFTILIGIMAALAAATIATNGAIAAYTTVSRIARAAVIVFRNAQLALNLAMMLNPVGLIIAAIVILVGLFVLAYKKSDRFRAIVNAVGRAGKAALGWIVDKARELVGWIRDRLVAAWTWLSTKAGNVGRAVSTVFGNVVNAARDARDWLRDKLTAGFDAVKTKAQNIGDKLAAPFRAVKDVIDKIIELIKKIKLPKLPSIPGLGRVGGIFSFAAGGGPSGGGTAPAPGTGGPPGVMARGLVGARSLVGGGSSSRSTSGAAGVQIIIQGAIDPDATARQIEKILRRRGMRVGSA